MKPLLTIDECAALLKCHAVTVRKMAKTGTLPSVMVGKRYRFDPDDLAEWARSR